MPEPDPGNSPSCWGWCKRSEEHTSELQSHLNLVCRLLLEKKKKKRDNPKATVGKQILFAQTTTDLFNVKEQDPVPELCAHPTLLIHHKLLPARRSHCHDLR